MLVRLQQATYYCDVDNGWHEPGETVDLPDDEAMPLIKTGSAALVEEE